MDDGLLSLKWNNHKSTFFHILSNLRKKETYTDATLACEGKFFPVHKLVMSTCSDYFSEVFERTTCKSPVVILKDIGYNDLEALLDYMYLGEVDVKQSELAGLIKAAECLRIKGLAVPDEDPSIHKKSTHVPDSRLSPSTKRSRRDSGGSDSSQHFIPSKGSRSHSPLNSSSSSRSHSTSSISSTPVPSHTVTADSLSQVPSHSMPPPIFSAPNASSSLNNNEVLQHQDQIIVPVDMIKVEVEDEGNNNSDIGAHNTPSERRSGGREEPRGEGGGSGDRSMKEPISNNFSEYTHHPGDIEKEEHDQIDYNGSEQLAGPSGVQGAPPIMNWGEEEGTFPHNLFGDDTSHQQVNHSDFLKILRVKLKRLEEQQETHRKKITKRKMRKSRDSDDVPFEGFDLTNGDALKSKKKLTNYNFLGFDGRSNDDITLEKDSYDYDMFNEESEEIIPYEICLEETDTEYIPPVISPNE